MLHGVLPRLTQPPRTPTERRYAIERRAATITPPMSRFLWDLRYQDATEIRGFFAPGEGGGIPGGTEGPFVVPGRVVVELEHGDHRVRRQFDAALDSAIRDVVDLSIRGGGKHARERLGFDAAPGKVRCIPVR